MLVSGDLQLGGTGTDTLTVGGNVTINAADYSSDTVSSDSAGFNGALLVVASGVTDPATATGIAGNLAKVPDVASASVSLTTNQTSVIRVIPKSGPNDPATADPAVVDADAAPESSVRVTKRRCSALPLADLVLEQVVCSLKLCGAGERERQGDHLPHRERRSN